MDKKKKIIITLALIFVGWLIIWIPVTAFAMPFPIVKEKNQNSSSNITLNVNKIDDNKN
ncbi:hypothetical protein ACJA29_03175 [Metamycoplasma sualvi]|uniref:hypothetical protein n=1 Tax=Metamycoplasma sualvi TaxID=2125 RepID=UPI003872CBDE